MPPKLKTPPIRVDVNSIPEAVKPIPVPPVKYMTPKIVCELLQNGQFPNIEDVDFNITGLNGIKYAYIDVPRWIPDEKDPSAFMTDGVKTTPSIYLRPGEVYLQPAVSPAARAKEGKSRDEEGGSKPYYHIVYEVHDPEDKKYLIEMHELWKKSMNKKKAYSKYHLKEFIKYDEELREKGPVQIRNRSYAMTHGNNPCPIITIADAAGDEVFKFPALVSEQQQMIMRAKTPINRDVLRHLYSMNLNGLQQEQWINTVLHGTLSAAVVRFERYYSTGGNAIGIKPIFCIFLVCERLPKQLFPEALSSKYRQKADDVVNEMYVNLCEYVQTTKESEDAILRNDPMNKLDGDMLVFDGVVEEEEVVQEEECVLL